MQTWRANTDFQVITSEYAIVNYIAIYASLKEMFQELIKSTSDSVQSTNTNIYTRVMMKIIDQRDIRTCEISHLRLSMPLYHYSRIYQVTVIKLKDYVVIEDETDETATGTSIIGTYCSRPLQLELITLFQFVKDFSVGKNKSIRRYTKERIVQVYPRVNNNLIAENAELYFEQQLMLHTAWRNISHLNSDNEFWSTAYARVSGRLGLIHQAEIDMSLVSHEDDNIDIQQPHEDNIFNERD